MITITVRHQQIENKILALLKELSNISIDTLHQSQAFKLSLGMTISRHLDSNARSISWRDHSLAERLTLITIERVLVTIAGDARIDS